MNGLNQLGSLGRRFTQNIQTGPQSKEAIRSFIEYIEIVHRMQDVEYRTFIQAEIPDDFIESKRMLFFRHQRQDGKAFFNGRNSFVIQ
jgi:hypothetical protein